MLVCYLTDEPSKIPAIRAMLGPQHHVVPGTLGEKVPLDPGAVLMVDADLRVMARVEQIKETMSNLQTASEKLFVVQKHLHHMVAQAYALGATSVVRSNREIGPKLDEIEAAAKAAAPSQITTGTLRSEIVDCAKAFATMFSAINHDQSIDLSDAERATARVIAGIERDGLGAWLDDVRRYHEGTFQHCLLVTGIAVGFAIEIGFTDLDIKRLGMAATLHDI